MNSILQRNDIIGSYKVQFFLKKGTYAENYRVKDKEGQLKFLKLFCLSKLHHSQFTSEGEVLEIEIARQLKHPNVVSYVDSGSTLIEQQKYAYLVLNFISGETLADKMAREGNLSVYEAKNYILDVLKGVAYLHSLPQPIIHNELTNLNVMLDLQSGVATPRIIDFGYARYLQQNHKEFTTEGLSPFYMANEVFNKIFSIQSDIFSVGALYYHLLNGLPPYFTEISEYRAGNTDIEEIILAEREKPLHFDEEIDEQTRAIIQKALQPFPENRFQSAEEFIAVLSGEKELLLETSIPTTNKKVILNEKKKGKGFEAIAGMQALKELVQLDIIDALNDKERYAEYGLTIPNGMLLYGPPGCGKTFFAERMAEEIEANFFQVKPSDIQSKWVNASQENIKKLFEEARKNAPSIIFIDELDALVPSRDTANISQMNANAVNEFLAQMNNCSEDGIFIIGATNRPTAIDPAILRSGRLDKHIYLPPPDFEAREKMFEIYLKKRPIELGLDYAAFASSTENFVSSDIKFICDEASRKALKLEVRISEIIVMEVIRSMKPSLSHTDLLTYEKIKNKMEGNERINTQETNKIGFK
ncbi:AAA family ATPase [Capnocytophaga leadbetteri]|uniref:AAA family ATPase n=1 Tax=Capnocytophaga leadbetteri TaxID=327575 RepID=UPI0028F164D8|nr:AAA family ATPase [Capnocytophaga leadbetteri]